MSLEWEQVVIDCADPVALARWWSDALGWQYWVQDTDEVEIRPTEDRLPGLIFGTVPEGKTIKNRLHLDFRPDDRDAEVDRLLASRRLAGWTSGRATCPGWCWPTRRATSSAS